MQVKRRVGVDLDGVCRNFESAFQTAFLNRYPHLASKVKSNTIYDSGERYPFALLGEDVWDFITKEAPKELFALADIYPGVLEGLYELKAYCEKQDWDVAICSHQDESIQHYSWLWLYTHQTPISSVIFVQQASDKWNHVDILIDDSPHVLDSKPDYVANSPYKKMSIKLNQPYNTKSQSDLAINHVKDFVPLMQSLKL